MNDNICIFIQYRVGQLFAARELNNSYGEGEGIEVLKTEPFEGKAFLNGKFDRGQYCYKIYHNTRLATIFHLINSYSVLISSNFTSLIASDSPHLFNIWPGKVLLKSMRNRGMPSLTAKQFFL